MKNNLLQKFKGTEHESIVRNIYNNDNMIRFSLRMLDSLDEDSLIETLDDIDQGLLKLFYDALKILILSNQDITEEFMKYRQTLQYAFISLSQELKSGISKLRTGKINYSTFFTTIKKTYLIMSDSIKTILLNPDKFGEIFKVSLILYPVSTKVMADLKNIAFGSAKEKEEKEEKESKKLGLSNEKIEEYINKIVTSGNADKWLSVGEFEKVFGVSQGMTSYILKRLKKLNLVEDKREGNKRLIILKTVTSPKVEDSKDETKKSNK